MAKSADGSAVVFLKNTTALKMVREKLEKIIIFAEK
jgi:hypothetical protein